MALSLEQQLILYMFHELQKNKILPLIYRANSQPPVYIGMLWVDRTYIPIWRSMRLPFWEYVMQCI